MPQAVGLVAHVVGSSWVMWLGLVAQTLGLVAQAVGSSCTGGWI